MTLLTSANRGAFSSAQLGLLDPSRRAQPDAPAGALPLDPADLLRLFASISALGSPQLASRGAPFREASSPTLAQTGAPQTSDDLARQRYVSGIADQIGRDRGDVEGELPPGIGGMSQLTAPADRGGAFGLQARQGYDKIAGALPAVLRGSNLDRTGAQPGLVMPVQLRRLLIPPNGLPGVPGRPPNEDQKKIEQGLMDLWNSFGGSRTGTAGDTASDDSDAASPDWLGSTPLGVVLGIIAEMRRRSSGRKRDNSGLPYTSSPSITSPDTPPPEREPDSWEACKKAMRSERAWRNYCANISEDSSCWGEVLQSTQRKRGWCANRFSD